MYHVRQTGRLPPRSPGLRAASRCGPGKWARDGRSSVLAWTLQCGLGAYARRRAAAGWALEAGFDRAGVATLEPLAARRRLHALARARRARRHGATSSAGVEARLHRRRLLDGARSALCVALRYSPLAGESEPDGDLWPRVARYARGGDYHALMEARLDALAARVEAAFPGARTRRYVDTGPVLERELAARAGLGVVGKNTMLLHREVGSWFLLGELFTTLDLDGVIRMSRSRTSAAAARAASTPARPARWSSPTASTATAASATGRSSTAARFPDAAARDARRLGLRLRRLPGGLPVEPPPPRAAAGGPPRARACRPSAASSTSQASWPSAATSTSSASAAAR